MHSPQKYLILVSTIALTLIAQLSNIEAKVLYYTLEVAYFSGSPDGIHKEKILGFNGQLPGPLLEAGVGDTFEIALVNRIQDGQNTTVHWHGVHQKGALFEDGTSMISQCPLPPGRSQIYRFKATQPGTYWYHSHVNSQYTEGLYGALVVHGKPERFSYDGEITLTLSDWYHRTAHENEIWHLSPPSRGVPPYPDSGLINGMGRYPCNFAKIQNKSCNNNLQMRPLIRIQRDKTYRIRLINAAALAMFNFSIDSHSFQTIEADGMDVETPVTADILTIAAGQRYSVLVRCNNFSRNMERVLIRASMRKESFMLIERVNINQFPEALMGDLTAVLECTDEDLKHKNQKQIHITSEKFTCTDIVPPLADPRERVFLDEMDLRPFDGILAPDHVDKEFVLNVDFYEDSEDIRRGSFNRTPFFLPHDKPLLMKLIDGETLPANSFPLEINYGSVVQVVINNPFFGPHPFHLHGHHFWILGMGGWYEGNFDPSKHNLTLNGVKRDTFLLQEQSWAVIRFVADSPGVWAFHCHIDWHNLSGMALTFIEGADIVRRDVKITDEALRVCQMHSNFQTSKPVEKVLGMVPGCTRNHSSSSHNKSDNSRFLVSQTNTLHNFTTDDLIVSHRDEK